MIIMMLLIWMLAAGPAAYGQATYYVDNVRGLDGNSGTDSLHAWKSARSVSLRVFHPGDRILFRRGGLWDEQLRITSSGAPGNPVVYGAYGAGPKPLFSVIRSLSGPWSRSGQSYTTHLGQAPNSLFAGGKKLTRGKGTLRENEWSYNARTARLSIRPAGGHGPSGMHLVWTSTGVGIAASGQHDVRIQEIAVAAPWDDGPDPPVTATGAGIRIDRCHTMEILNCTVTGSLDENVTGIHIAGTPGFVVQGCEVFHTLYGIGVQPLPLGFPGRIEKCVLRDMDMGSASEWDGINVGSMDVTDFSGLVIRGNDIAGFCEDGIDIFFAKNILIEGNYIHDSGTGKSSDNQQGIKSVRSGNIIRRNRIENIGSSRPLPGGVVRSGILAGGDSTEIVDNQVARCGSYGILIDRARHVKIWNNSVLDAPVALHLQRGATADMKDNTTNGGRALK